MSTSVEHTRFVSVRDAALRVGYSSDYVARLAREGKVLSEKQGRQWLVELDSLKLFILEMEAQKRLRQEELRRERRADLVTRQYRDITHRDISVEIERGIFPALATSVVFTVGIMLMGVLSWQGTVVGITPSLVIAGLGDATKTMQTAFALGSFRDFALDLFKIGKVETRLSKSNSELYSCSTSSDSFTGTIGCVIAHDSADIAFTQVSATGVENLFSDPVTVRFFDSRTGTITPQFRNARLVSYPFSIVASERDSAVSP